MSDSSGTILRANRAATEMFGHSDDELVGQNARLLIPGDMTSRHDGFIRKHLETGQKRIIGVGRDVEGLRADGSVFPLHLSVGPAQIDGEKSVCGDITRPDPQKSGRRGCGSITANGSNWPDDGRHCA